MKTIKTIKTANNFTPAQELFLENLHRDLYPSASHYWANLLGDIVVYNYLSKFYSINEPSIFNRRNPLFDTGKNNIHVFHRYIPISGWKIEGDNFDEDSIIILVDIGLKESVLRIIKFKDFERLFGKLNSAPIVIIESDLCQKEKD